MKSSITTHNLSKGRTTSRAKSLKRNRKFALCHCVLLLSSLPLPLEGTIRHVLFLDALLDGAKALFVIVCSGRGKYRPENRCSYWRLFLDPVHAVDDASARDSAESEVKLIARQKLWEQVFSGERFLSSLIRPFPASPVRRPSCSVASVW